MFGAWRNGIYMLWESRNYLLAFRPQFMLLFGLDQRRTSCSTPYRSLCFIWEGSRRLSICHIHLASNCSWTHRLTTMYGSLYRRSNMMIVFIRRGLKISGAGRGKDHDTDIRHTEWSPCVAPSVVHHGRRKSVDWSCSPRGKIQRADLFVADLCLYLSNCLFGLAVAIKYSIWRELRAFHLVLYIHIVSVCV